MSFYHTKPHTGNAQVTLLWERLIVAKDSTVIGTLFNTFSLSRTITDAPGRARTRNERHARARRHAHTHTQTRTCTPEENAKRSATGIASAF